MGLFKYRMAWPVLVSYAQYKKKDIKETKTHMMGIPPIILPYAYLSPARPHDLNFYFQERIGGQINQSEYAFGSSQERILRNGPPTKLLGSGWSRHLTNSASCCLLQGSHGAFRVLLWTTWTKSASHYAGSICIFLHSKFTFHLQIWCDKFKIDLIWTSGRQWVPGRRSQVSLVLPVKHAHHALIVCTNFIL